MTPEKVQEKKDGEQGGPALDRDEEVCFPALSQREGSILARSDTREGMEKKKDREQGVPAVDRDKELCSRVLAKVAPSVH